MTREKGPACEGAKKETLGECINRLRRESGQTLRGLAKEVGVSPAFLSDLEKGRHQDRAKLRFGVAYQEQVINKVPREKHDYWINTVITG